MKTSFPIPPFEGNVISLEVVREGIRSRQIYQKCTHQNVVVDTSLTSLHCKDCNQDLNPVEWIASRAEFYDGLNHRRLELIKEQKRYEAKKRCRCEHCGKITSVKPATAAEVRQFDIQEAKKDMTRGGR